MCYKYKVFLLDLGWGSCEELVGDRGFGGFALVELNKVFYGLDVIS